MLTIFSTTFLVSLHDKDCYPQGYVFLHPLFTGFILSAALLLIFAVPQSLADFTSEDWLEKERFALERYGKPEETTETRRGDWGLFDMLEGVKQDSLEQAREQLAQQKELEEQGKMRIPRGSVYIWVDPDDPYLQDPVFGQRGPNRKPQSNSASKPLSQSASFDDNVIRCANQALLQLLEGNLGAMVAVAAGIGAIFAIAFGAPRAALSFLIVCLASFTVRSFVILHFGEQVTSGQNCDAALGLLGESSEDNAAPKPGEPLDPFSEDPMDWGLGT